LFSDSNTDLRIAPEVFDPSGGLTCFGEQVEAIIVNDEPDLDFAG